MRPLLSETADERRLKSAQRALDNLSRKRPQCYTGRQHYLRELHGKAKILEGRGRSLGAHVEATIMKEHGARWKAMSERERSRYEAKLQRQLQRGRASLTRIGNAWPLVSRL